ncbi:hypothetical protein RND71_014906 [Anisodus tanguticus]|uniref:Uncharacterized protein n=1 Tax=Anisodus tanguticus TaxID=243964 RepID=A0AAE1SDN2_9SOLA|nr:hypothetical protein RND71_014906 [Anisodus tanguticus]
MAMEMELDNKVYVAINLDIHDGFMTLQWALKRWSSNSITIVILYASNNICKDYVITPKEHQRLVMAENMTLQEKKEALRIKFVEIKQAIHASKEEAKTHVEGQAKAQWAITLCTRRAEENDGCINDEIARKADLKRELDATKDELSELHMEVEVTKSKLNSILELQRELSNKMQLSSLARSRAEVQVEKVLKQRRDTLH